MASQSLFGNHISPACKYCREGIPSADGESVLCPRKGVTSLDFKCRHYYYDPLSRVPKRPLRLEKFDAADFSLEVSEEVESPEQASRRTPPHPHAIT